VKAIRKTICVLVAALFLCGCSTIPQAPYEPVDSPLPPVESTMDNDAWRAVKAIAGIAVLVGLVALLHSIPAGMPAMR
jgi:hypothetical protein